MSAHTPGPWHVTGATVFALHGEPPRNRFSALAQAGRRDDATWQEQVANAHLMAASPDLLQMLHECAEYIAALNGEQDDYCQRARALIARATGEVK